jgi:hypothetical protein
MSFQPTDSAYKKFGVLQEQPQDMRDMFPIRDRVDAFVRGLGQTSEDMARIPLAGSPRTIQYSPVNAILKAPHIDSPYMDQLIQRGFRPLSAPIAGPQLPGFV